MKIQDRFEIPCPECNQVVTNEVFRYVKVRDPVLLKTMIYHALCYQKFFARKIVGKEVTDAQTSRPSGS
jgi:hypothetical protein